MAVDLERLVVQLSADVKQYQNAMNKAMGITNRNAKSIETRFAKMNRGVSASFIGMGRSLIGVFAGGVLAREVVKFSDAATRIDNALKIAGLSGEELEKVYGRLRDSATKNAAPIEALVQLYGRAAMAQKELNVTQEEMIGFANNVAIALRVAGTSAEQSRGALIQLSQAIGAGIVRAEEFNAILEGALPIAQAAAAGLKEAGGSVAKLRTLIIDGKVSSEAFFRAFEAGAVILDEKVANATFTVAQATGNLNTALIDVAREFNTSTGASERFAGGINNVAKAISDFDVSGFINKISEAHGALERFMNDVGNADIFKSLNEALGISDADGNVFNFQTEEARQEADALEREVKLLQDTIAKNTELGFDNTEALASLGEVSARLAALRSDIAGMPVLEDVPGFVQPGSGGTTRGRGRKKVATPVSLNDFAAPDSKNKGSKGGKGEKDFPREVRQIQERTAALQAETAAMAGLNPLINDYGFALEKASATQELLSAAKKQGLAITPELRAQIDALATGYANASVAAEQLAEAQDKAREAAEEMRDLGKNVMGGFISDLVQGKSAADALAGALGKIGDKLLDLAMNNMFGQSGSSGFGILGSLFGFGGGGFKPTPGGFANMMGIPGYANGTNNHPGGLAIVGERGPELLNLPRGSQVIPRMPKIASGGGGASVNAPVSIQIDARGADREGLARVEQQVAKLRAEIPARVIQGVREANKKNVKFG